MNGLSYSFDMPYGNYIISVNHSYFSTVSQVTTNTTNTYSGINGLYYLQNVADINLGLSFVTRPQWWLSGKPAGSKLQPGDPIISFVPSSEGANWLYVVFPGDENGNKTIIRPSSSFCFRFHARQNLKQYSRTSDRSGCQRIARADLP